jgi:hypothetical protein
MRSGDKTALGRRFSALLRNVTSVLISFIIALAALCVTLPAFGVSDPSISAVSAAHDDAAALDGPGGPAAVDGTATAANPTVPAKPDDTAAADDTAASVEDNAADDDDAAAPDAPAIPDPADDDAAPGDPAVPGDAAAANDAPTPPTPPTPAPGDPVGDPDPAAAAADPAAPPDPSHDATSETRADAEAAPADPAATPGHGLSIDLGTTVADGSGYTVTGTGSSRVLTFTPAAYGNSYLIVQTGTSIFRQISVQSGSGTLDLTVQGISVRSAQGGEPTFALQNGATVALTLVGENSLTQTATGSANNAALNVPAGTSIAISGSAGDRLTVQGGGYSAGIGGGSNAAAGDIAISGGTVTATGGGYSAGIGGGSNAAAGDIAISGGTVTATGGDQGAGIGGGSSGAGGTVTISGGTVTATGIGGGAGIGGGSKGDPASVTISAKAAIKAYSRQNSGSYRPAIHTTSVGNQGSGYYVNAYFVDPPSAASAMTFKVYGDGGPDVTGTLVLPAGYRCFAYTTGKAVAQSDAIAMLDPAVPHGIMNAVACVPDSSVQIPSVNSAEACAVKLVAPQADGAGALTAADIGTLEATQSEVIDLSRTETGGPGYSVDGTTHDGGGNAVANPDRVLTFGTNYNSGDVNTIVYRVIQSRGPGTSLYRQIVVEQGVDASITVEGIDVRSAERSKPTFVLKDNATLKLVLSGTNSLVQAATALGDNAALSVPAGTGLSVSGDGSLTVQGGQGGAGIGSCFGRAGGTIAIHSGTVTATGGNQAAGIGGGYIGAGGTITIYGGTIVARGGGGGGGGGAGIGGGYGRAGGTITIHGGTVTATGGSQAAGIGGGNTSAGGTITIHGGTVTATGTSGAGIGGGEGGDPATVTIGAAATVKAYSSQNSGDNRPAIHADSAGNQGSGYYVNACFADPPSATVATTLKVYGDSGSSVTESLVLPANYRCFAYATGGAVRDDAIDAYDAAGTTQTSFVVRDDAGASPMIPSAKAAAPLRVKLMALPAGHPLTVSKKVASDYADTAKAFGFTLWFYEPDGRTPLPTNTRLAYTGGVLAGSGATAPASGVLRLDAEGRASVSLSHGQSITIGNVADGSQVRILEDLLPASPYVPSFTEGEDGPVTQGADTGVRPLPSARHSFAFTNTMPAPPATGLGDMGVSSALVSLAAAVPFALVLVAARCWLRSRERGRGL